MREINDPRFKKLNGTYDGTNKIDEALTGAMDELRSKNLPIIKTPRQLIEDGVIIGDLSDDKLDIPYDDQIYEMIKNNDSCVIVAETGAGKTVSIAILLAKMMKNGDINKNAKIAITQPRVFPAVSISKYESKLVKQNLGEFFGLQTKDYKETSSDTQVTFMTDGLLTAKSKSDRMFLEYDVVVIDEAHERNLNIDISMAQLKEAQRLRAEAIEIGDTNIRPLKIIVMSATIEKENITSYLSNNTNAQSASIEVPGKTFKVDEYYSDQRQTYSDKYSGRVIAPDYDDNDFRKNRSIKEIRSKVLYEGIGDVVSDKLLSIITSNNNDDGDILIFMPNQKSINDSKNSIKQMLSKNGFQDDFVILELTGSMSKGDQGLVFDDVRPKKKIIISTNVAETSVTIDGVTTVIDSGLSNQVEYDKENDITTQGVRFISKANARQRKGRAGRTQEGNYYTLYSKEDHENFEDYQKPEILRLDMAHTVLLMKNNYGNIDVKKFDFMDKPSSEAIDNAEEYLKSINAIGEDGNITDKGSVLLRIHDDIKIADILYESKDNGSIEYLVLVSSFLGIANKSALFVPFFDIEKVNRGDQKEIEKMESRKKFDSMYSKFAKSQALLYIEIFNKYKKALEQDPSSIKQFCYDNFIIEETMKMVSKSYFDILGKLRNEGIAVDSDITNMDFSDLSPDDKNKKEEEILKAVASGFIKNLITHSGADNYGNIFYRPVNFRLPDNVNFGTAKIHPMSISSGFRCGSNEFLVFIGPITYKEGKKVDRSIRGDVALSASFSNISYLKGEWIPEIAPHLVDRELVDFSYNSTTRVFEAVYRNKLKSTRDFLSETKELVVDQDKIEELLVNDLMSRYDRGGYFDLSNDKKNIIYLEELSKKTGGFIALPDIRKFYADKVKGCKTPDDTKDISFNISDYYSKDTLEMVEKAYPDVAEIRGKVYEINYVSDNIFGSYVAKISLNSGNIDGISDKDFEFIGKDCKRPNILYVYGGRWDIHRKESHSLNDLKIMIDKDRINDELFVFISNNQKNIANISEFDFASLEKESVVLTKDINGKDVIVYPCVSVDDTYDYDLNMYIKKYKLTYSLDKYEAYTKNERALNLSKIKEPERKSVSSFSSFRDVGVVPSSRMAHETYTLADSMNKDSISRVINDSAKKLQQRREKELEVIKQQSQGPRDITKNEIEDLRLKLNQSIDIYKGLLKYINSTKKLKLEAEGDIINVITKEFERLDIQPSATLIDKINGSYYRSIKNSINKLLKENNIGFGSHTTSFTQFVERIEYTENIFNSICEELGVSLEDLKSKYNPVNDFIKIVIENNFNDSSSDSNIKDVLYNILGKYV